jgi:hypothetical protein
MPPSRVCVDIEFGQGTRSRGSLCLVLLFSLGLGSQIIYTNKYGERQYFFPKKINRDYAAVLATPVKSWFRDLRSGEDIPNWAAVKGIGKIVFGNSG